MKYIMVTNWNRHWDNIPKNKTRYSIEMLRGGMTVDHLQNHTETVFIKRNKATRKCERTWIGTVNKIDRQSQAIYFDVIIQKEIPCPSKYQNHTEGWYAEETSRTVEQFDPLFFKELVTSDSWEDFEDNTYNLLRCLGIHDLYRYERTDQSGKADGFFRFQNFAVIYDSTMKQNFEGYKEAQINNYCQQLKKGYISKENIELDVRNCKKRVWIIIPDGLQRTIKQIDDVKVKAVPIEALIELYRRRLKNNMNGDDLERELINL